MEAAFGFLAAELLLAVPTLLQLMQLTGSTMAPALSDSTMVLLARLCSA